MVKLANAVAIKKEFLRLLEVDEEFRLVVAAKLGLLEILNELKRLREDFNKLYQKSLEHDKRFEEMNRRFEAIEKKLLEHDKRFEEMNRRFEAIERKLLEHDKRFETIERRLEEHDKKFNEILEEIKKIWLQLEEHNRRISRIELELGALAESFYSKALWDDLREEIASQGERILFKKRNFRVDESDIDLFIETNRAIYIAEIKVKPRHEDVGRLIAKRDLVKNRFPGKRVVAILAGALIGKEIEEYARSQGLNVYTY